jgi:hypothetical protein
MAEIGRRHPAHRLAPGRHPASLTGALLDEHDVQPTGLELVIERFAQGHGQGHVDIGMAAGKLCEHVGQGRQHEILAGTKAQLPAQAQARQMRVHAAMRLQHAPRVVQERLPFGRERHAVRIPRQQAPPGEVFQAADLLAHGRLPRAEHARGSGEAAAFRHGDKGAQEVWPDHRTIMPQREWLSSV